MKKTVRKTILNCCIFNKRLPVALLVACLPFLSIPAQDKGATNTPQGWYMGIEGGTAFGVSTFSSFGADKTRAGYTVGVFAGYQFNPILALELNAKWGNIQMSARKCCADAQYWLSEDSERYAAEVLGQGGAYYGNLKSDVYWQNYALRLNINVLGFVPSLRNSPWKVEVSPQLSLVGSWAKNIRLDTDETVRTSSEDKWKLGYGGTLQASYHWPSGLMLGLYSGMTFVNGGRIDSLPKTFHKNNFAWESGVRIGWQFQ